MSEIDPLALEPGGGTGRPDEIGDVDVGEVHPPVDPQRLPHGHLPDLAEHGRQVPGVPLDEPGHLGALRRLQVFRPAGQGGRQSPDGRDRRAEVVGQGVQEVAPGLVDALQVQPEPVLLVEPAVLGLGLRLGPGPGLAGQVGGPGQHTDEEGHGDHQP